MADEMTSVGSALYMWKIGKIVCLGVSKENYFAVNEETARNIITYLFSEFLAKPTTEKGIDIGYGALIHDSGPIKIHVGGGATVWADLKFLTKAVGQLNENRNNDKGKGGEADNTKVNPAVTVSPDISSVSGIGSTGAQGIGDPRSLSASTAVGNKLQPKVPMDNRREESDPWERFSNRNPG